MKIDIYDFDKTIVPFDSGTLFTLYCLVHYPWCIIMLPMMCFGAILLGLGIISFTAFKRFCFLYTKLLPLEKAVCKFWDKYDNKVFGWFKERERYTVVISASPDFLLGEIQKRLGIEKLISTRYDEKRRIIGENCRDEEKVRRLYEEFDKDEIEVIDVYSDSLSHDKYIFALATGSCYNIVKGERIKFNYSEKYGD